ncbi:TetR/AcrR family transcriptional regulator [Enterococcus hulanensis]|uniref:TetR/AcrR family transcriptional regulator n=1 Tax=Enterococcus hulanensis TaxID=2559929 RepID=UPI001A8C9E70|nr:TetR/AcrR family transcriptional regulator [Enterococcus hulanensis]MBO0455869.1 TetR/AcrR family transcriptional regulator [Enterococcus hulanensis]
MTEINTEDAKIQGIINAALKEFAQRGYEEASTNRIAKAAGMSKALMFHYVKSKEELLLMLLDYCRRTIAEDYLNKMDLQEKDIFTRLLQSYTLQIELMKKNPWIFDFTNLKIETNSAAINQKIAAMERTQQSLCADELFASIDESKFRPELDVERSKQLILWGNIGFTNEILAELKNTDYEQIDYQTISAKLTQYLDDLKTVFYRH